MTEPMFECDSPALQGKYDAAVRGLRANIRPTGDYPHPVLWEGAEYAGIWLECGPHESLVFIDHEPETARHCHEIFMHFQKPDGQLPCWVRQGRVGYAQVQAVVPFARTALEVATRLRDQSLLRDAYHAAARYDRWLSRHRDTLGTGCCEMFCQWDTGHDHSPRSLGLPEACPEADASKCPPIAGLPYLAPDLTASVYGARVALTSMANLLDETDAVGKWRSRAMATREALMQHLFDREDACFYDRKADGQFLRIRSEALMCVLRERAVDQVTFENIYQRHIRNQQRFWTPYPFPSVAVDDPAFARDLPANCWGGAAQALAALRAPLWMEHYGKWADLAHLMKRWVEALVRAPGFMQQMNPFTGEFRGANGYSPAMLCMVDFVGRLYGVREQEGRLQWNCRLPEGAMSSTFRAHVGGVEAELRTTRDASHLLINGREIAHVIGAGRVVTDPRGRVLHLVGTEPAEGLIVLRTAPESHRKLTLTPNTKSYL